jgi:hypothetical protein
MAVFHKKYRDTGLQAFDCAFKIGPDGRLSPDPEPEVEAQLAQLPNYTIVDEGKSAPKKAPKPDAAELEESEPLPASKKKRSRKKASKKA